MEFSQAIIKLYSGNSQEILEVINNSIYVTDLTKETNECAIYTGFTFVLHTGSTMELLYDFTRNILIRQLIPNLSTFKRKSGFSKFGLIFKRQKDFFDTANFGCINGINKTDESWIYEIFDTVQGLQSHLESKTKFQLLENDANGNVVCTSEYPLEKKFNNLLFFDGTEFSFYVSHTNWESAQEDYNEPHKGLEDWLNEEFGDEASTAYWNID